jgi:hypothetical protein
VRGTSIAATPRSAPSRAASASRTMVDNGAGICGFYPGSEPGEFRDGTAATFDQARADTHERVLNRNLSFTDVFYPLNGGNVS